MGVGEDYCRPRKELEQKPMDVSARVVEGEEGCSLGRDVGGCSLGV